MERGREEDVYPLSGRAAMKEGVAGGGRGERAVLQSWHGGSRGSRASCPRTKL